MAFEKETKYFEDHKTELLEHHLGKFALIKDAQLVGVFDTMEAAFNVGVDKFGMESFLVKPILEKEKVENVPALTHHLMNAHL